MEDYDKRVRGPYLGRLELHRVMLANELDAKALMGDFLEMLVEYFRLFGEKQCCTNDVSLFLHCLNKEQRSDLAARLLQVCEISSTTLPRNVMDIV